VQQLSELHRELDPFLDLACRLGFSRGLTRLHARQCNQKMVEVGSDEALAKRWIAARQIQFFFRDYVVSHGGGHR